MNKYLQMQKWEEEACGFVRRFRASHSCFALRAIPGGGGYADAACESESNNSLAFAGLKKDKAVFSETVQ